MLKTMMTAGTAMLALGLLAGSSAAQPKTVAGAACGATTAAAAQNNATEPKSGRRFFLEFPCDLKAGEKVTLILNLHGAGSSGSYQHRYFPAADYMNQYRLVVATPTAATAAPTRTWQAAADDQFLHDLTDLLFAEFGKANIKSFWLAGHSQGGATSQRIVCSDYFRPKIDGFLSLSGGRVGGGTARNPNYSQAPAGWTPPANAAPPAAARGGATPGRGGAAAAAAGGRGAGPVAGRGPAAPNPNGPTSCDYSHIYAIGEHEIAPIPATSPIAEKFGCTQRVRREVVDERPGYVYDPSRQNPPTIGWGHQPRPGKAEVITFTGCRDGRVVADVVRLDKGHTEGLEPKVTEEIVKLITSASGGAAQRGGS